VSNAPSKPTCYLVYYKNEISTATSFEIHTSNKDKKIIISNE